MASKKKKSSSIKPTQTISKNIKFGSPKVSGYYGIIIFLVLLFIDRITKIMAISMKQPIDFGIFAFTYTTNTGAGFSILNGQNTLLAWIMVIALGAIIYYHDQFPRAGFLLIIAGLIGNLIDRVTYGYVIDFINFKFWPVFNASDSFIFIGAIITIVYWWKIEKEEKKIKSGKIVKKKTIKTIKKKVQPKK